MLTKIENIDNCYILFYNFSDGEKLQERHIEQ